MSSFGYIPKARGMSSALHEAARFHFCAERTAGSEKKMHGRKGPSYPLAAKAKTLRKVKSLKYLPGKGAGKNQTKRRRSALDELWSLLPESSLAEWSSFSENICEDIRSVMDVVFSVFTIEPLHDHSFRLSWLLKSCPVKHFLCSDVYRYSPGPSGKQKRLGSQKTALMKACKGTVTQVEKKSALLGLYVNFSKKGEAHSIAAYL